MADLKTAIQDKVTTAVTTTVVKPEVQAELSAAPAIIDAVLNKILPIILNSTNNEPWYQSRVLWGQVLSVGGIISAGLGVQFNASTQQVLVSLIPSLIGVGITLYGRFKAKKPLGS